MQPLQPVAEVRSHNHRLSVSPLHKTNTDSKLPLLYHHSWVVLVLPQTYNKKCVVIKQYFGKNSSVLVLDRLPKRSMTQSVSWQQVRAQGKVTIIRQKCCRKKYQNWQLHKTLVWKQSKNKFYQWYRQNIDFILSRIKWKVKNFQNFVNLIFIVWNYTKSFACQLQKCLYTKVF